MLPPSTAAITGGALALALATVIDGAGAACSVCSGEWLATTKNIQIHDRITRFYARIARSYRPRHLR